MKDMRVASWPGYGATHNPFIRVFLDSLENAGCAITSLDSVEHFAGQAPDILLLHWAERVFGESKSRWQMMRKIRHLLRALSQRPAQTRVVWLVHNLMPHDARPLQKMIWPHYLKGLVRQVDGFLTLSPGTVEQVRASLPALAEKPALGLWHPSYPDAMLSDAKRISERTKRGWTASNRVLGYCGQIRPYKGVEQLLQAFGKTTDRDLRLFVAGRPGTSAFADQLHALAARDTRISLDLRNLSATEFRDALGVCDRVVAPFRNYLHSGSMVHALSAGCPVLTPTTPFANSLQDLVGPDWVQMYDDALTPELLETGTTRNTDHPDLSAADPDVVGQMAVRFFRGLT